MRLLRAGLVTSVLFAFLTPSASAQNPFSAAAIQAWKQSITAAGYMGAPRYTTLLLPTCNTNNKGAIAFDTTAGSLKVCDGTNWNTAGGLTSPVAGDYVATGKWTFGSAADAAKSVRLGETAGALVGEGATADASETTLAFGDATADNTLSLTGTATGITVATTTGSTQFTDNNVLICDDGNFTRCIAFQASGITAGNTRTLTVQDSSATLAILGANAGSLSINAGFGLGVGVIGNGNNRFQADTSQTPDTGLILTGTTSNSWTVMETQDAGTDAANGSCGTSACTHPQLHIVSATAGTQTLYNDIAYWGNAGRAIKALTEASNTSAFQVSIASGAGTGGTVDFTVFASDATDHQTLTGVLQFSGVNKGGTETCPTPTLTGTALNAVSAGTLTCTYAADTTPSNACNIQFNCTSSLTQTTLDLYYRVNLVGPGQVTPQ